LFFLLNSVTKSSALTICNKTEEQGAFASGQQNATFKFPVKIESTETQTYVYAPAFYSLDLGADYVVAFQVLLRVRFSSPSLSFASGSC
jgi:hypothetical protein